LNCQEIKFTASEIVIGTLKLSPIFTTAVPAVTTGVAWARGAKLINTAATAPNNSFKGISFRVCGLINFVESTRLGFAIDLEAGQFWKIYF
jgi:hypothetical protein